MSSTALYIPLKMILWKDAPLTVDGHVLNIMNDSRTIGYIPVYQSLEDLQKDYGKDCIYNQMAAVEAKLPVSEEVAQ